MSNNDTFPDKVLEIFLNNLPKIKLSEEENSYDMVVFLPIDEKSSEIPDFTGYAISLEKSLERIKITIHELNFGPDRAGFKWNFSNKNPIEVVIFKDETNKDFHRKFEEFELKYKDYLEEEDYNRTESVKNLFINNKFIFDDPVLNYLKNRALKEKSSEAFSDEPEIMFFGKKED